MSYNKSQFSNSNGVTFGTSGSVITASINAFTGNTNQFFLTANSSLLQATSNTSLITSNAFPSADTTKFAGTNGAITGGSITVNTNGVSVNLPAYLTTAAQSNHSHNFATTTTNGSLIVVGTTNSNGATIGVPAFLTTAQPVGAYLTTARASNDAIGLNTALTANGLSVTANSSGLSINVPAWLTTAAQSNHSHGNPTLALTNISGTTASNSAGLTLSLSAAAPGAGGGVAISGGANSQSTGTVNFANSNGITFGLSNNGTMTASHNGLTTQSAQAFSADASSTFQTLVFQDSNGVSFSNNAGSLRVTHALQFTSNTSAITSNALHTTSPRINVSAGTTSNNLSAITFNNANGITFGLNASTITASHNGLTTARASNDGIGLNTAQSNVTWTVNSNGLSIDARNYAGTGSTFNGANISGSMTVNSVGVQLSLSANAPGAGGGIANAAGTQTATSGTVVFSNSNGITFGMSNSSVITASHNGITTAALSDHSHGNPTLNLTNLSGTTASNSAGFTLSLSAAAPGGGAAHTYSYHMLAPWAQATATVSLGQSTSGVYPFVLPGALSMDRVRMLYSGSVAASSTQATTGNTSLSMSAVTTHNLVFYSRGAGASSLSIQYVTSTQQVDQQLVTFSFAVNSTQYSVSNRLTLGTASFTKDYSNSAASINYQTSNLTDLTGARYIDLPAGLSLSQGQWWVAYGRSTVSATQNASISVATRMLVSHNSQIAVTNNTLAIGMIGGNTNSSVGFFFAHGSYTTGGAGGTTSSIPMANVSTLASNNMLHMQFMRIT